MKEIQGEGIKWFLDWQEKDCMKEDQGEGNKMVPRWAEKGRYERGPAGMEKSGS